MKNIPSFLPCFLSLAMLFFFFGASAQSGLRTVQLPGHATLHFVSPEPIQYVDISTKHLQGDLPIKNVLRLRVRDSVPVFEEAVITIAGEKFMAQFRVVKGDGTAPAQVCIEPVDMKPLDISGIGLSQNQLRRIALDLISRRPSGAVERAGAFSLKGKVNSIYAFDDYIFLDLSYRNKTNLRYAVEDLRFKIDDQKVTKASNVQSLELKPVFTLLQVPAFEKSYRNIIVLKKMSFPGNKVLHIELSEQQPSGRTLSLGISYQEILHADPLPN
ncbi:DUF4138 domain-containing protein [Mucilaginibacter terrae]|uniref:Conjugative transposon TraN protein n=1 Tax=Mucilaginibacter terrae TaxID=1955052 RepID=A0ABU3GRM4_9SPHI|nr:DUF4138 domain-containing protein [Mucilaginibacter terrae]MDT3401285.1 conjugative transposon TraN protein [Mucilaginibacter terrae]